MDLDSLIILVYCWMDEGIRAVLKRKGWKRLRRRGPAPTLTDAEVLTLEVVGAFLGYSEDKALFDYFRRHYSHFFPALSRVDRTTFTRQAANLWKLKEAVWMELLEREAEAPSYAIADSLPLPACRFARAYRCKRFRGEADYGKDWVARQTFYGFRLHALAGPDGLIRTVYLTPANEDEKDALADMTEGRTGRVLGDRNFWSPHKAAHLRERGVQLIAPFKLKSKDPHPHQSAFWSGLRYRIETVFSQFTERYEVKRVWAKDLWHLTGRLLRCVLSHTVTLLINRQLGHSPLRLAHLLSV